MALTTNNKKHKCTSSHLEKNSMHFNKETIVFNAVPATKAIITAIKSNLNLKSLGIKTTGVI